MLTTKQQKIKITGAIKSTRFSQYRYKQT